MDLMSFLTFWFHVMEKCLSKKEILVEENVLNRKYHHIINDIFKYKNIYLKLNLIKDKNKNKMKTIRHNVKN